MRTLVFFTLLLVVGLYCFRDYGLSWDEITQRQLGTVTLNYITGKDKGLLNSKDRSYGQLFETCLIGVEKMMGFSNQDTQKIFYMRHLVTFFLFYISVVFFFFFCREAFHDSSLALLGCLMLVIFPRIFAHAFINSKDIPFLSFMIISSWSAIRFIEKPSLFNAVVHSFCSALAIDSRISISCVFIIGITAFLYVSRIVVLSDRRAMKTTALLVFYVICTVSLSVLMWPSLWENPLGNFISYFGRALNFDWSGSVLYMGQWLFPVRHQVPWHYLPVWIGITVPLVFLFLFFTGSTYGIYQTILHFKEAIKRPYLILSLMWFFIPIVILAVLKSNLCNGWRHVFFVYPALVILAVEGYRFLAQGQWWRRIVVTTLVYGQIAVLIVTMVKLHPYEHFYLNELTGSRHEEALKKFQLDLWLVEFRPALEYILKTDRRPHIKVYLSESDGRLEVEILPANQHQRFIFVHNPREADYNIFDFYRWHDQKDLSIFGKKVYSLIIDQTEVLFVYKKV